MQQQQQQQMKGDAIIGIVRARNLPVYNTNGSTDAYVVVQCHSELNRWRQKTAVIKKTVHPTWNEEFLLSFPNEALHENNVISFSVYNRDVLWKDAELGHSAMKLKEVFLSPGMAIPAKWVNLERAKQTLRKPTVWLGKISGDYDSRTAQFSRHYQQYPAQLLVKVQLLASKGPDSSAPTLESEQPGIPSGRSSSSALQEPPTGVKFTEPSVEQPPHVNQPVAVALPVLSEEELESIIAEIDGDYKNQSVSCVRRVRYIAENRETQLFLAGASPNGGAAVEVNLSILVHPAYPNGKNILMLGSTVGVLPTDESLRNFVQTVNRTLIERPMSLRDFVAHCDIHFGACFGVAVSAALAAGPINASRKALKASIRQSQLSSVASRVNKGDTDPSGRNAPSIIRSSRVVSGKGGAESVAAANADQSTYLGILKSSRRANAGMVTASEWIPIEVRQLTAAAVQCEDSDDSDSDDEKNAHGAASSGAATGSRGRQFLTQSRVQMYSLAGEDAGEKYGEAAFRESSVAMGTESRDAPVQHFTVAGMPYESRPLPPLPEPMDAHEVLEEDYEVINQGTSLVEDWEKEEQEEEDEIEDEDGENFMTEKYRLDIGWESTILDTTLDQHVKQLQALFGADSVDYWPAIHTIRFKVRVEYMSPQQLLAMGLIRDVPVLFTVAFPSNYLESPTPPILESVQQPGNLYFPLHWTLTNVTSRYLKESWPTRQRVLQVAVGTQPMTRMRMMMRTQQMNEMLMGGVDPLSAMEALEATGSSLKESRKYVASNLPTSDGNLLDDDEVRQNYVLLLFIKMNSRLRNCMSYCMICDSALPSTGVTATVCDQPQCVWSFESLGLGANVSYEVLSNPDQVELLISMASSAVSSSRCEQIMQPFPPLFMADASKQWNDLGVCLRSYPAVSRMSFLARMTEVRFREEMDLVHPKAYTLLRWLLTTCRSFITGLHPSQNIAPFETPNQYVLLSSSPLKLARFDSLREKYGSFFAYHGSGIENFHSILRQGLRVLSGTDLMTTGARYGKGIYLSPNIETSRSYSVPGHTWSRSRFGNGDVRCMIICEVINHPMLAGQPNPHYVVPDEDLVVTRFFLLYENGRRLPKAVDLNSLKFQLYWLLGYTPGTPSVSRPVLPARMDEAPSPSTRGLRATRAHPVLPARRDSATASPSSSISYNYQ